jgi:hypothetical protein
MLNNQEISTPVLIEDLGILPTPSGKEKRRYGLYKCSCGSEFKAQSRYVINGNTKSCGCVGLGKLLKRNTTHGMVSHKIYHKWCDMIRRCTVSTSTYYYNYGGRGISVCERWINSFENFRDDMLPTWGEGLTIDRINNDGNYEPSNCRWTTRNVQARNTRKIIRTNTSDFRGVSFHKATNKWHCSICISNKSKYLGLFSTPLEAAKAYDKYVIENNLEHTLNGVINEF